MKNTKTTRRLDDLGRIVLPIDMRKRLGISCGDPVFFECEDDRIIIKRAVILCDFCGSESDVKQFGNGAICVECMAKLKEIS